MDTIVYILLGIGLFVNAMSIVGILRFPDMYTRLHAATKTTTFGSIFMVIAVIIHSVIISDAASTIIIIHSAIALLVVIFTNPISAHAIARAALIEGIKPSGAQINQFDEKKKREAKG